jgi:hypothetical protein
MTRRREVAEFGDFQTPLTLARDVCDLVGQSCVPATVVEPTCGVGTFLQAAHERFADRTQLMGLEINADYLAIAKANLPPSTDLLQADFFQADWPQLLGQLRDPLLIVGNPPWVTNSQLGVLGSANLPEKKNAKRVRGIQAMTGQSNFDISEWMLIHLIELAQHRDAMVAMLCKTTVARRVLEQVWRAGQAIPKVEIFSIDARRHFGASVDACLLVCQFKADEEHGEEQGEVGQVQAQTCAVYGALDRTQSESTIGFRNERLLADVVAYDRWQHLAGSGGVRWRSGIKHDCSRVMEFTKSGSCWQNGLGQRVSLETDFLYPLLKTSQISGVQNNPTPRWLLVPQSRVGADTAQIKNVAPKTWDYLQQHRELLDARRSSIYRHRPPFSIFGVGDYTFAKWKVAISGFYKQLNFRMIGSHAGKPIVLDDSSYFLPCKSRKEAQSLMRLLNSAAVQAFYKSQIFWDAKRPITVKLLATLDLTGKTS